MKKALRLSALVLIAAMALSGVAALAESITTTGSLNLRKGPGLDYRVLCSIDEGVKLTYDRTSEDDRGVVWYRVRYNGMRGWVSSMYAREGGGDSEGEVTTTNNVHLRTGPGTDYASRLVIDAGTVLSYDRIAEDEDGGTWYHVSWSGKKGWISSRCARKGSGDITGSITTTGDVFLRSGPDRDYSSRGTVPEGTTLSYDRTETDERDVIWYHVQYDGVKGWVSSMYARKGGGSSGGGKKVRTTGSVFLRSGPGLDYSTRDSIDEGETLTYDRTSVDDRGVTWYHVNYYGEKGWVSSKFAKKK